MHYPEDRKLILVKKVDAQPETAVKDGLEMVKVQKLRTLAEYEDTDQTILMRDVLRRHNGLLSDTSIDIPDLEEARGDWTAQTLHHPSEQIFASYL
nr:hypothetical protein [uncultured Cohaesibacter sp.]